MLMNVPALRNGLPAFIEFIINQIRAGSPNDQPMYNEFYKERWERLDITLNWKPYWGLDPSAQIVHWHGPKPVWVQDALKKSTGVELVNPTQWWQLLQRNVPAYREFLKRWEEFGQLPSDSVRCVVDIFDRDHVRGWALDRANPTEIFRMEAYIDGQMCGEIACAGPRRDVMKAGEPTDKVGFRYQIPAHFLNDGKAHQLEFRSATTGTLISIQQNSGKAATEYEFWGSAPGLVPA